MRFPLKIELQRSRLLGGGPLQSRAPLPSAEPGELPSLLCIFMCTLKDVPANVNIFLVCRALYVFFFDVAATPILMRPLCEPRNTLSSVLSRAKTPTAPH